MARLRFREVRVERARCGSCGEHAVLRTTESRHVRGWRDALDLRFDPRAYRTATCAVCGATYPVPTVTLSVPAVVPRPEPTATDRDWRYA